MAIKLIMPKLGLNMVEGELVQWMKKEGDPIKKGEIIYVVETDKMVNEVESPDDGILYKILVKEGNVVPVREIVGVLAKKGEQINLDDLLKEESKTESLDKSKKVLNQEKKSTQLPGTDSSRGQIFASPLVKRMAAENDIDLATIKGSGPGGRIMSADIEKDLAANKPDRSGFALPGKLIPLSGVRKVIAERMAFAARTMAMVTLNSELDVSTLVSYREKLKSESKGKSKIPGINAILISLIAKALKKFPYLNAAFTERGIRLHDNVNIGLAVDTPEGLVVVVVNDANRKDINNIQTEVSQMVERAQDHKSNPGDIEGSTFTITNLGNYGVDSFNPIINPPQTGILGVCRIKEKEVFIEGTSQKRQTINFSLTFDHRVIDGAPAAQFLLRLEELIFELNST